MFTTGRSLTNLAICESCSRLFNLRVEYHAHAAGCRFCGDESEITSKMTPDVPLGVPPVLTDEIINLRAAGLSSRQVGRLVRLSSAAVRMRLMRSRRRR